MTQARFRTLAVVALVATLGVILWGAVVRATGSGAGCGSHWPTCNGEVLPRAGSLKTLVEFTHRATSGAAFLLVALELVWAYRAFPAGSPVRRGAAASMFFMTTEAAVGAALVLLEHVALDASIGRAAWMSLHLVNTFLLIAAMTCTAWWARGGAPVRLRGQGAAAALLAVAFAGVLAVGVTGAIAALGDTLFAAGTLRRGLAEDLSPAAHFLVRLRALHPIVAAAVAAYLLVARGLVAAQRPSPAVERLSSAVAVLVALQVAAGVVNLLLLAPVWMQLVHLLLADLLWIALVVFAAAALAAPAAPPARAGEAGAVASGAQ